MFFGPFLITGRKQATRPSRLPRSEVSKLCGGAPVLFTGGPIVRMTSMITFDCVVVEYRLSHIRYVWRLLPGEALFLLYRFLIG
jgi:hypothetical protein